MLQLDTMLVSIICYTKPSLRTSPEGDSFPFELHKKIANQ